eukprot:5673068-Pyramimonas_sp.AAC.1
MAVECPSWHSVGARVGPQSSGALTPSQHPTNVSSMSLRSSEAALQSRFIFQKVNGKPPNDPASVL